MNGSDGRLKQNNQHLPDQEAHLEALNEKKLNSTVCKLACVQVMVVVPLCGDSSGCPSMLEGTKVTSAVFTHTNGQCSNEVLNSAHVM